MKRVKKRKKAKPSLKTEIKRAVSEGTGARLRIPFSNNRIGTICAPTTASDEEIMAHWARIQKIRKARAKKEAKEWRETLARIAQEV